MTVAALQVACSNQWVWFRSRPAESRSGSRTWAWSYSVSRPKTLPVPCSIAASVSWLRSVSVAHVPHQISVAGVRRLG